MFAEHMSCTVNHLNTCVERMTHKPVKQAIVEREKVSPAHRCDAYRWAALSGHCMQTITADNPSGNTERESQRMLGPALQGQLELLRSKGFKPVRVHTDPKSTLRSLATKFENVEIDIGSTGD